MSLSHQQDISIITTAVLKNALQGLKLEKVEADIRKPEMKSILDLKSQLTDNTLSPGHMIELRGADRKRNL